MPMALPSRPPVRALRPSEAGMKPRFYRGDVLRVLGVLREDDGSLTYELISLNPPGQVGRAPKHFFEEVGWEPVHKVRTEEEKEAFLRGDDRWRLFQYEC